MVKITRYLALLITITMVVCFNSNGAIRVDAVDNSTALPSGKIIQIAASRDNTVILMEDGTVWAWGDNSCRQLGEGVEAVQKSVFKPVKVSGLEKIKEIAVGNGYILALDEIGQVWGLGNNIGNVISATANLDIVSKPIRLGNLNGIIHIAAGTNYAAAVRSDGAIWLWGQYRYKVENSNRTIEAKYIANVQKIFTLRYNTIAIDKNGTGWICRGKYLDPEQIEEISGIVDIIEGVNSAYAVRDDGSVWSWNINTSKAEQVDGLHNIKSIVSVKDDDFIALDEEGSVWSWDCKSKTLAKNPNLTGVVSIAAGTSHFAALKSDNTIWSWGDNSKGQLGNGGEFFHSKPVQIESLDNVKQVAASKNFTAAVKEDGTVWIWGSISGSYSPVQVKGIDDVEKVAAGISHVLALKKDGTVWSWGSNLSGELGDGTYVSKQEPVQVKGIDNVKDIAAGNSFSIAVGKGGRVWVWGSSGYGDDEDPKYQNKSVPVEIKEFNSAKQIAAGHDHGMALKVDGSLWAWGSNGYGQFGSPLDDKQLKQKKAVRVVGLFDITQVGAGYGHNIALKRDGTVVSWGNNDYGQLGSKTSGKGHSIYVKYAVKGLSDVKAVAAGRNQSFAVKKDGTLWAWGDNSMGQLGTNAAVSSDTPVEIPDIADIKCISAGYDHSAAVRNDGTLWAWGSNLYGQLGIGKASKAYESAPVKSLVN